MKFQKTSYKINGYDWVTINRVMKKLRRWERKYGFQEAVIRMNLSWIGA